jgi:hypothetical protein
MSEPNREARRRRIIERVKSGETREEIMQNEQISRVTLWSDLKALDKLFLTENSTEIKELKRRVGHALLENADNVLSGDLAPDQANAWRAIMSDFSELFGLNAPSRSVTAHVSSNLTVRDLKLRSAASGLDDDQLESVLKFAKSLPRYIEKPGKDASWFPAPQPKVLEGSEESAEGQEGPR